jgi:hypothetical protein
MGTRADFYDKQGIDAEWLGSIAWDGGPDIFSDAPYLFGEPVTPEEWRRWVAEFLAERGDATMPEQGWPWPWENSQTTDYAYALHEGKVTGCGFGYSWFVVDMEAEDCGEPDEERPDVKVAFPDMSSRMAVTHGKRSGLLIFGLASDSDA